MIGFVLQISEAVKIVAMIVAISVGLQWDLAHFPFLKNEQNSKQTGKQKHTPKNPAMFL